MRNVSLGGGAAALFGVLGVLLFILAYESGSGEQQLLISSIAIVSLILSAGIMLEKDEEGDGS